MAGSRNHDNFFEEGRCTYHPHEMRAGKCSSCQTFFCKSCAVTYPGREEPTLCLDCGLALFLQWWGHALSFAFFGVILGWWLLPRLHLSHKFIWHIAIVGGYCSWAAFYGWHCGARVWNRGYKFLRKKFRRPGLCLALMAMIGIPGALVLGACGGGLRMCLRTFALLLKRRRLGLG